MLMRYEMSLGVMQSRHTRGKHRSDVVGQAIMMAFLNSIFEPKNDERYFVCMITRCAVSKFNGCARGLMNACRYCWGEIKGFPGLESPNYCGSKTDLGFSFPLPFAHTHLKKINGINK